MTTSLAALGRAAEAEQLYNEARASSASASVHMQAAYATAMLYTRHHDEQERDDDRALGWINEAIAIARLLPDVKDRAMQTSSTRTAWPSSRAIRVIGRTPCAWSATAWPVSSRARPR